MPSSTETLSIVAVNLSFLLVLSAVYVLLCILSLRLFHRDPVKHPVPSTVQSLIIWLEVLVCLDPPAKNKIDVIRMQMAADEASSDVIGRHNDKGHEERWAKRQAGQVGDDEEDETRCLQRPPRR